MDFKALQARVQMQNEAKDKVRLANYIATLLITVGGGKTKIMIDLALELIDKYKIKSILYVCDNTRLRDSHKEGFPEQLKTWGTPELRKIITLECYQTTRKWKGEKFDLLLADEADFAMTTEYCKVFFNNTFRFKILVTGTMTPEKKRLCKEIAPIVFKCTTLQAEARGIINKTKYHLYNYKMSEDESKKYVKYTKAIAIAMSDGSSKDRVDFLIRKRKELLCTLDSSQVHCRKIMGWLGRNKPGVRLIIFCERTSQADRCCKWSYHGGNAKENHLDKFQNGEIAGCAVVSKVTRGINLKNANTFIFESITSSSTAFSQRNGRGKRLLIHEVADSIFMCPWYRHEALDGTITYKPTKVIDWITSATKDVKAELIDLKL